MNDNVAPLEPDRLRRVVDELAEAIALRDLAHEGLVGAAAVAQIAHARETLHPDWVRTRYYARTVAVRLLIKGFLR